MSVPSWQLCNLHPYISLYGWDGLVMQARTLAGTHVRSYSLALAAGRYCKTVSLTATYSTSVSLAGWLAGRPAGLSHTCRRLAQSFWGPYDDVSCLHAMLAIHDGCMGPFFSFACGIGS